jgi:transposase-like protein
MAKSQHAAPELASPLDHSTAGERIPKLARHGLQPLMELEVAAVHGAHRHERIEERLGYRNGYGHRSLTTQVRDIEPPIRKLRGGRFLSSILEPADGRTRPWMR